MVVVERAVPVTIIEDGKSRVVYTTQQTVQGVVDDAGYNWKKMMPMEDGMTKVKSGMQIHVVPYTVKRVKRTETMPVTYRNGTTAAFLLMQQSLFRKEHREREKSK